MNTYPPMEPSFSSPASSSSVDATKTILKPFFNQSSSSSASTINMNPSMLMLSRENSSAQFDSFADSINSFDNALPHKSAFSSSSSFTDASAVSMDKGKIALLTPSNSSTTVDGVASTMNDAYSKNLDLMISTIDPNLLNMKSNVSASAMSCKSSPSRVSKRERVSTHTPRPSNSFIIYRREKHAEIMNQYKGARALNNNVISKIVASMWKQESAEAKAFYAGKAEEEKKAHALKYPDYKYRPRKAIKKTLLSEPQLSGTLAMVVSANGEAGLQPTNKNQSRPKSVKVSSARDGSNSSQSIALLLSNSGSNNSGSSDMSAYPKGLAIGVDNTYLSHHQISGMSPWAHHQYHTHQLPFPAYHYPSYMSQNAGFPVAPMGPYDCFDLTNKDDSSNTTTTHNFSSLFTDAAHARGNADFFLSSTGGPFNINTNVPELMDGPSTTSGYWQSAPPSHMWDHMMDGKPLGGSLSTESFTRASSGTDHV